MVDILLCRLPPRPDRSATRLIISEVSGSGKVIGLLVTYERPQEVRSTLAALASQTRRLDRLLVVDNGSTEDTRVVIENAEIGIPIDYVSSSENLGSAGGVRFGMEVLLPQVSDDDWIVLLDDDDPPKFRDAFETLEAFAYAQVESDPRTAAVGIHGSRFDWKRGRLDRVQDGDLRGAVKVDYVGMNGLPFHRVAALRGGGVFSSDIFFGLSEVEHGLRLRRAGWSFYAHGELWRAAREGAGRIGHVGGPTLGVRPADWRRYYTLRNLLYILLTAGRRLTAVRVTLVVLIGKPLLNMLVSPRVAGGQLLVGLAAARDGWTGRMGRTREPYPWGRRPLKATHAAITNRPSDDD